MSDFPKELQISVRPRHYGLGLRAQMLLALTAAFALSFSALSIIVVSAAQRAQELEHGQRARSLAEALATSLSTASLGAAREHALSALVGRADVIGARLVTLEQVELRFGATDAVPTASALLRDGEQLSLWMRAALDESPLGRLLRLYSLVTGSLILLIVYVALTRLIVRPVEQLTRAVERLPPDGPLDGPGGAVSIAGAAELARLAVAFNGMVRELRRDRGALEARLRELEETTRALRTAQDQLIRSEKLASVGRLAAGVAHEIGNPLAAILGLVELLQLGSTGRDEEREFLARIRSETERIHHIIRDLLDYARAGPAVAAAGPERVSLEQVVEEAVALIAPQKDLRRVTIERRVYDSCPDVRGSAHELTQVVLNLLLNAADAVGGEGHILIELARDGEAVRLTVGDSGPGIPRDVRDKLFDPFFTTKPAGKGTGLGLAVCHAIVARLGGTIVAEPPGNDAPRGARFTVRLLPAD